MFQAKALVATIVGITLIVIAIPITIIGFTLLQPILNIEHGISGTSSAAYGIPTVFFCLAGLSLIIGLQRLYVGYKYSHESAVMESFSPEDEKLQEELQEESDEQNIV